MYRICVIILALISIIRSYAINPPFYVGGDLSYTNELEDGGVTYYADGKAVDLFTLFHQYGANMIRLRLWHQPTWTNYSTYIDVARSAHRIKDASMDILLDLHYSDTWTDPQQNLVPAAWRHVVSNTPILADSLYQYTYRVLTDMHHADILPAAIQIGNETNNNILVADNALLLPWDIDRTVSLMNAGIKAVNDFNRQHHTAVKTVLHVALKDDDALRWVAQVKAHGILPFDVLGISYYPQWHLYPIRQVGQLADILYNKYGVQLLIAETGHIWTRRWKDNHHNLISEVGYGYPQTPCPQWQKDFLIELKNTVRRHHGYGVMVWEPGWVSSDNKTLWGTGSSWENVTFFDFNNQLLKHGGMEFMNEANCRVTFRLNMSQSNGCRGFITGDFTDDGFGHWQIVPMKRVGTTDEYTLTTYLSHGQSITYHYLNDSTWQAQEKTPQQRQLTILTETDSTIYHKWTNN